MRRQDGHRGLKVVVAYARLHPDVRTALEAQGIEARYCDVSGDVEAAWRLLCALWAEQETFVYLEQDKIPAPGAIQEIYECPSPWCAYPVPMQGGGYTDFPSLSCVKFSAELMHQLPRVMEEEIGRIGIGGGDVPPRHYLRLDMAIALWLHRGRGVCWHPRGLVRHEHEEDR